MSYLTLELDRIVAADGTCWAAVTQANLLAGPLPHSRQGRVVAWSGWFGEEADAAAGRFPRDYRTWTSAGWSALDERVTGIEGELVLRPHARHVLSDAQSCVTFLRRHEDRGIRLLLDPISILTVAMLGSAEEHVMRCLETLGGHPQVAGVLVAGGERAFSENDEDSLRPAAAGAMPDEGMVKRLVEAHVPAAVPRIRMAGGGERA